MSAMVELILVFWLGAKGEPIVKPFYDAAPACERAKKAGPRARIVRLRVATYSTCDSGRCSIPQDALPVSCKWVAPPPSPSTPYWSLEARP